jgi:hypothetical protein
MAKALRHPRTLTDLYCRMTLTRLGLIGFLFAFAVSCLLAADDSPISSPTIATDTSPAAIAAAETRGAATAAQDIKAGNFRILYFGLPWSSGKRLVDEKTGYRVQVVGGCVVTEPFVAEVQAYNEAMRKWHARESAAHAR